MEESRPMPGAPRSLYADQNFIVVHLDMIEYLGDWNSAGVFQRIAWRCEQTGQWRATYEQIAADTRLSREQVKRALARLKEVGWIETSHDHPMDRTITYQPVWNETPCQPERVSAPDGGVSAPDGGVSAPDGGVSAPSPTGFSTRYSSKKLEERLRRKDSSSDPLCGPDRDSNPTDEIRDLCEHLADWVAHNGNKRPAIGKRWYRACRLMIEVDGHSPDQIRRAIDWSQRDGFWSSNILSMPKLREKYPTLRLRAKEQAHPGKRSLPVQSLPAYREPPRPSDEEIDAMVWA